LFRFFLGNKFAKSFIGSVRFWSGARSAVETGCLPLSNQIRKQNHGEEQKRFMQSKDRNECPETILEALEDTTIEVACLQQLVSQICADAESLNIALVRPLAEKTH